MKKYLKVLSIFLAISMVVSIMFVGATAETSETVNGTELFINDWYGTNDSLCGSPTKGDAFYAEMDRNPLLPNFPSTRLVYSWDKEGSKYKVDDIASFYPLYDEDHKGEEKPKAAKVMRYNNSVVLSPTSEYDSCSKYLMDIYNEGNYRGIMFYIKLHEDSNDTNVYLEGLSVGFDENGKIILKSDSSTYVDSYNSLVKGSDVYLMPAGTDKWNKEVMSTLGNGEKATQASISLVGGFEGWVYVPAASWINTKYIATSKYLHRVNWYVNELVSEKDIQISNLMVVDGDVTTAKGVTVGGFTYNFANNRYYSSTKLDVESTNISIDGIYGVESQEGKNALSYNSDNTTLNPQLLTESYNVKFAEPSYYNYAITPVAKKTQSVRPTMSTHQIQFLSAAAAGDGLIKVYTEGLSYNDSVYTPETWPELFKLYEGNTYVGGIFTKPEALNKSSGAADKPLINAYIQTKSSYDINNKAVLAYVKHQGATQPIKISFTAGSFYFDATKEIYAYDLKTEKWTVCKLTEENSYGCVEISSDFEGWFMLPYTAFNKTGEVDLFRICPDKLGGDYGELLFGNITLTDSFNPLEMANGSAILLSEQVTLPDNFPFKQYAKTEMTVADTCTSGGVNGITGLTRSGATLTAGNNFTAPLADGAYTPSGLTRVEFKKDNNALLAGTNQSFAFKVDNSKGGDLEVIVGSDYLYMNSTANYYLLEDNATEWTKKTIENSYALTIGSNIKNKQVGAIVIPEGFVGWISIPFESLTVYESSAKKISESKQFYRIDFMPISMTGSITFGCVALFSNDVAPKYYFEDNMLKGMNATIGDLPAYSEESTKQIKIENGVLTSNYDELYTSLNASGSIAADGALMFYAKNTADTDIIFNTSIGNNSTVKGYTLAEREWKELSQDGNIVIRAGFDGWVKIAVTEAVEFESIKFMFKGLKNGLSLSDFMVLDKSADLDMIKTETRYATGLFYTPGDFNADSIIDIRDLVCAKLGEFEHDITKLEDDKDPVDTIRRYIFNLKT